ncbi:MAG TPA: hypothetical protein VK611_20945 [Acidimicrobiales bacterium]|nr:hypothetical protein [Acidimicrobiales bacterium]
MRARSIHPALVAILLSTTSLGLWSGAAAAAPAAPTQSEDCPNQVNGAQCPDADAGGGGGRVVVPITLAPGDVPNGGPGPECPSGPPDDPNEGWMTLEEWEVYNSPGVYDTDPQPEGATTYWVFACFLRTGFEMGVDFDWLVYEQGWGGDDPPEPGPTATDILEPLWAHVQGLLLPPVPVLAPDEGTRSTLEVPTFVAIDNPQPATEYRTTFAGITVWITVDPTVTLHPGEPDAPAVACDDDGTTYDPGGAGPRAQAEVDGACAHVYGRRTGAAGRPDAWAGDVTISWVVNWGSSEPGQEGALTADPSVGTFDRIVDEVQGVMTEPGE